MATEKKQMDGSLLTRIRNSLRSRGLFGSIRYVFLSRIWNKSSYLSIPEMDDLFDRKHGVNTAGVMPGSRCNAHGDDVQHASSYQAIFPEPFAAVMKQLPVDFREFTFIDIGSGKGRATLLASEFPFERIVGIEFSRPLHDIAEANCPKYRSATQKCKAIELLCMDATEYDLPAKPEILYLYNPFGEEIMKRFVAKIERSLRDAPRMLFVIYFWPVLHELFDKSPSLEPFPIRQPTWPGKEQGRAVAVWVTKHAGKVETSKRVCLPQD
jgi:SAM-dependent methyltransferase